MRREDLKNCKRVVVKVGTSTLSYQNGRLNFQRMEELVQAMSDLREKGMQVVLVSSGAIGVGAGRFRLAERPTELHKKQALAALGQAQLVKIYQKLFSNYGQIVAQVLLTKDVMTKPDRKKNAHNTLAKLLELKIIPIINENDTISTDEIEFGDNDTLSARVAKLIKADLLVLMSDIDGLYSSDPKTDKNARIIQSVPHITPQIESLAKGSGSSFGTGGMMTKITAAKIAAQDGIDTIIANGDNPSIIFEIIEGKEVGTHFIS